jgi:hypothetical protein
LANYYWVGGTGTWNSTNTANWSLSSGGAGGAGVPTSADNAYFDANSDAGSAFTVTIGSVIVCADIIIGDGSTVTALDQSMTLNTSSANNTWSIHGSLYFPPTNFTRAYTNRVIFAADSGNYTITTNGATLTTNANTSSAVLFSGGANYTLGSALQAGNTNGAFAISGGGSLDTANFALTVRVLRLNSGSLILGSSTVTINPTTSVNSLISADTNVFTVNAGTSTINIANPNALFTGGGQTYYNVSFTSNANGTHTIRGANTFNDLTFTSQNATGIRPITFDNDQIVNGTLTLGIANTAIRRLFASSDIIGIQRTITLNGTLAALADVDFRDIKVAGTVATPWTGTRLGNCLGNSGITFDAPKTVYWNLAGAQNWSATGWATTNNGAPAANNFPLAQDTATFTEAGAAGTVTVDTTWNIGSIQMADGVSNRTTALTLATGTLALPIYGSVTLFSGLTLSGTGTLTFAGNGVTQNVTSAGVAYTQPLTVDAQGGTVSFKDALTAGTFTFNQGVVELKEGVTSTLTTFSTSGTVQKILRSGLGGVQATLSQPSGTVDVSYLTIQDINVTGGATWNAFVTDGNIDGGNNTGWDFFSQLGKYIYTRRKNKRILL